MMVASNELWVSVEGFKFLFQYMRVLENTKQALRGYVYAPERELPTSCLLVCARRSTIAVPSPSEALAVQVERWIWYEYPTAGRWYTLPRPSSDSHAAALSVYVYLSACVVCVCAFMPSFAGVCLHLFCSLSLSLSLEMQRKIVKPRRQQTTKRLGEKHDRRRRMKRLILTVPLQRRTPSKCFV